MWEAVASPEGLSETQVTIFVDELLELQHHGAKRYTNATNHWPPAEFSRVKARSVSLARSL